MKRSQLLKKLNLKTDIDEALKALFCKDNIDYEFKEYRLHERITCFIKTYICLKFKLIDGSIENRGTIINYNSYLGGGLDGIFIHWTSVYVSPYLFKDWKVSIKECEEYEA